MQIEGCRRRTTGTLTLTLSLTRQGRGNVDEDSAPPEGRGDADQNETGAKWGRIRLDTDTTGIQPYNPEDAAAGRHARRNTGLCAFSTGGRVTV